MPKKCLHVESGNYNYNVMSFGLKNADAAYWRLMDAVLAHQIGGNLDIYVEDMVNKILEGHNHANNPEDILQSVRKYDMCLNLVKCSFGVHAQKVMGFMLTKKGIEVNPYKCQAVIDMRSPTTVKEVQ